MSPTSARRPAASRPLSPSTTARWVGPALLPVASAAVLHLLLGAASARSVLASAWSATLWGASLVAGLLVIVLIASALHRPRTSRRERLAATGATAAFILLTALSARLLTLPVMDGLEKNWQGKILDLLWIGILFLVLRRWARDDTGLRLSPQAGSARSAVVVVLGVLALFTALGLLAVTTGEGAVRPVGPEQLLWDTTVPNLSEELIWRGAMLAVLDRAFPPGRRVLGATMGWGSLITALVFGLGHTILLSADGSWSFSAAGGGFALVMGLALAWIRTRTGSIWPAVALHCAPELGADLGVILGT